MASSSSNPKASQNKPKRPRENDSDTSENEHRQPTMSTASPRFLVIHSQEERSISSLSPFVIEKVLIGMAGEPRSIKKLRSGDLLVEYTNKKQIESLLRLKSFHNLKVQVSLHACCCCCFGFNGPLRQYFSLYRAVSQREGERGERIDESKNVQTTPTRTNCKRNRPLPYCDQNCRMPRHWKFTQHHRTTRPPRVSACLPQHLQGRCSLPRFKRGQRRRDP